VSNFEDILGGVLGGQGQGGQSGGGLSGMLGGLFGNKGGSGGGGGANVAAMAAVAAPLVMKFLQGGRLEKLLSGFKQQGMQKQADSWVSTEQNEPITAQQLEQVAGTKEIDEIAQQVGASREQTAEVLAQALPQVVDKVTPNGQLPAQADVDDALGQLFAPKTPAGA
jgi:uncharacterized protein YidB (DUF937 family)